MLTVQLLFLFFTPMSYKNHNTYMPHKERERKPKKIWKENLRPKESSGRSLPKTDEFRGPGEIARRGHCESYKNTEAAMVRLHKKDGRRKSGE